MGRKSLRHICYTAASDRPRHSTAGKNTYARASASVDEEESQFAKMGGLDEQEQQRKQLTP